MKTPYLTLLAGGALGFALSQITLHRPSEIVSEKSPGPVSHRSQQQRIPGQTKQTTRSLRNRQPLIQLSFPDPAAWEGLAQNPLTATRILAQISQLNEPQILDLLATPTLSTSDEDFIEEAHTIAAIRLGELLGPQAFQDPQIAAILKLNDSFYESEIIVGSLELWTLKNPDIARKWFQEKIANIDEDTDSESNFWNDVDEDDLLLAFISSHERVRKGETRKLAERLPSQEDQSYFLSLLAQVQVEQENDPAALKNFLSGEDSMLQQKAIEKLLEVEPPFARDWITKQVPSEERDQTLLTAAQTYFSENFEEASEWFLHQELVTSEARSQRLVNLVSHLASNAEADAAQWLLQQPDSADRDQAEQFMARQKMQNQNFDESVQWISRISDPKLRQEIISEGLYGSGFSIITSGIRSGSAAISSSSIDHILNNPNRTNSDFIETVDRVHIPGIPFPSPSPSPANKANFREAAERAGLTLPSPE